MPTDRNTKIRGTQVLNGSIEPSKLKLSNSPVGGYYLKYNSTGTQFEWKAGADSVTEVPTGLIDGINLSFACTSIPINGSFSLYLNGMFQRDGAGKDYLLTGTAIEFNIAPGVGDELVCSYNKENAAGSLASDKIQDADQDTSIEVEKNPNENIIRVNVLGTEQIQIRDGIVEPALTNDVDLGSTTKSFKDVYVDGNLSDGVSASAVNNILKSSLEYEINGGGSVIGVGIAGTMEIPFNCVVEQVTLVSDQVGSIVVDIKKATYAAFPTTASMANAGAKPTISLAQKSQDSTLTSWTTSIVAGDILEFNVDSVTTIQRCLVSIQIRKN